jgi:hypothetical protein
MFDTEHSPAKRIDVMTVMNERVLDNWVFASTFHCLGRGLLLGPFGVMTRGIAMSFRTREWWIGAIA